MQANQFNEKRTKVSTYKVYVRGHGGEEPQKLPPSNEALSIASERGAKQLIQSLPSVSNDCYDARDLLHVGLVRR